MRENCGLRGEELDELYDAMIFFHIILHLAVLIYDFPIFITSSSSFHGFITIGANSTTSSHLACKFNCQSAARVSQSSRVRILYKPNFFFFRLSFHNCKSCVSNCDDLLSYNSNNHLYQYPNKVHTLSEGVTQEVCSEVLSSID